MSVAGAEVLDQIAQDVACVEHELESMVCSEVELVHQVASHTLRAGGKRLRPAIVALCARATSPQADVSRAHRLGACMELIHMATLVHDDVIDHSATRRGTATAAVVFGNTASILSGDVMLAKAMAALALDGDLRIIRTVSSAVVELAEGEVAELHVRGDFDLTEQEHLRILRMKTASVIRCCCEVGGLVSNPSEDIVEALREYGERIGIAFQIIDDIIDYEGDPAKTGKPVGTDFREGCSTLPLIFLRGKLQEKDRILLCQQFGSGSNADTASVISQMQLHGVFEQARAFAKREADLAVRAIQSLPYSQARETLESVGEFILERSA